MTYDSDNIFAKILRGEIPCNKAFENDHVLAFHDIEPKAKIHILIIPKGDYTDAHHFNNTATGEEIIAFYKSIPEIVKKHDITNGYRLITNAGPDSGQEVPHYHIHLLAAERLGPNLAGH